MALARIWRLVSLHHGPQHCFIANQSERSVDRNMDARDELRGNASEKLKEE